ncbi:hypothetical protein ATK36_3335 [Amycolatopsis sulphurea]|uniref:Uncharacterized protein n=1 Tax=Amycolatopsis sulphurea TaxID=76022 RepID=A0A2A9FBU0_9PSEU|nr:hypothetical protein [Amycolatopsis sulphurea]PFG48256.1 hypothetical protein ATK36_3335 [Amycolatopsis sulphurea]
MTAQAPSTLRQHQFNLVLPGGFIDLPRGDTEMEQLNLLARELAEQFGLDPDTPMDQGMAEATVMLATTAAAAEAGGSSYTAAGFFRSPEDLNRPITALVNCFCLESDHTSTNVAIAGLDEVHRSTASGPVEIVELPVGPAVVAQSVTPGSISVGEDTVEIAEHAITAWIPGTKVILGLAVTSNNTEDWAHVVDLARGIFGTFEWADAST